MGVLGLMWMPWCCWKTQTHISRPFVSSLAPGGEEQRKRGAGYTHDTRGG